MLYFRNLPLDRKINLIVVFALVLLAFVVLGLEITSTNALTNEIGQFEIEQESVFIERNFVQLQEELQATAVLFATTPGLVEAVINNNDSALRALSLSVIPSLQIDEFIIVNAEAEKLIDTTESGVIPEELVARTLLGIQQTTVFTHDDGIAIVSARFLRDEFGTIVGGLLISQQLDADFLNRLNFGREGIYLGLIYNDEVLVTNAADDEQVGNDIGITPELVSIAISGITSINPEIVFSSGGTPFTEAYIPVVGLDDRFPSAVFAVRVDNGTITRFQQGLIRNSGLTIALVTISIIVVIIVVVRLTVSRRIATLEATATEVAQGNYTKRANIKGEDEVGKLASAFNQMAESIELRDQQRETQIQETEAARIRAERADQVKSTFLASMSHELRTPLNAIINFSKFVARGDLGPVNEDQEETLFEVVDSARHLLDLINDVLDMSKIESDSLSLFVVDNIDLKPIINQVVSTGQSLLDDKSVEIHTEVGENLPPIRADRQRIVQILLNIMSNACKFTEEGSITVHASHTETDVIISISDTGQGIAPEDQAMVFDAFKQTETGLRQGGGTGLGMPITKSLVEAHGGRLQLESEPGKGTKFVVNLPIKSDALTPTLF